MSRIIGGVFGLDLTNDSTAAPFENAPRVDMVNGRSAILLAARSIDAKQIWLPSYLCMSILDGLRDKSWTIRYYEVGYELTVTSVDWVDEVTEDDLVVVIDYFGFQSDNEIMDSLQGTGAWVVLDACQALYAEPDSARADMYVYSPRKFLGVADGGVLALASERAQDLPARSVALTPPPDDWWWGAYTAIARRRDFELGRTDRSWYALFTKSEANAPTGMVGMSGVTRAILAQSTDFDAIALKRRSNYERLLTDLQDIALFTALPVEVVPLGLPIRVSNREKIRQHLIDQEIYPPVHWEIGDEVPVHFEASRQLSQDIMTIPCDQRYGASDMERIIAAIDEARNDG